MELGVSGLASGFDWRALVDQLMDVERVPQARLRNEQNLIQQRNNAYGGLATQLGVLRNRMDTLKSGDFFNSRLAQVGDSTVASAAVSTGAPLGTYTLNVTQLAAAAVMQGQTGAGAPLNATSDVSGLVLSEAGFPTAVTAGTFTVNNQQVTLAASDTLQQVFDKISAATTGAVTGSYDPATDKITLAGSGTITLGTATDTSNFLSVAKLYNNGTSTVASASSLGGLKSAATLDAANFATAVSDGGSGAGEFKVNGVSIAFDAGADSLQTVITRINDSSAGVTASYDAVNNRLLLTNKSAGDVGIALADVTGNFLTAGNLSNGTLSRGKNLLYTINGGSSLTSLSNTITEASSGITGLSVTALKAGSTTVEIASDTARIKTAINDFLTEYNKAQSLIESHTASSTNSAGKVTAGMLTGDSDANDIAVRLRRGVFSEVPGLTSSLNHLEKLGITSNGNDDKLTLASPVKLDEALATNLSSVKALFTDESNGIATRLDSYLERTIGDEGTLVNRQATLTSQSSSIDTQITDLERIVQSNREQLINSFVTMEVAQSKINQQLQFLAQRFPSG